MEKQRLQEDSVGNGSNSYVVYTDGAYSSSRDQGGIGIVILKERKLILRYSKMYKNTTNNRMELGAIITAMKAIKKPIDSVIIYTDSMYCIGCASLGWKRKKNQLLWKIFDEEFKRVSKLCPKIEFRHVKGHEGNYYNEMCDKLAVKASQEI